MELIGAGLLAAIPVGIVCALVVAFHLNRVLSEMRNDPTFKNMSDAQARWFWIAVFGLAPFLRGIIASLVYGYATANWNWGAHRFLGLALGLAIVMSILALVTRTVLAVEKIAVNFVVALGFGVLIPLIAG